MDGKTNMNKDDKARAAVDELAEIVERCFVHDLSDAATAADIKEVRLRYFGTDNEKRAPHKAQN